MSARTIAVLTSGGDAPGMNAAIRAVVRAGITSGLRVMGVRRGYNGLLSGDAFEMNLRSVSDIIHRGGTALYTARSPEFNTPEGVQRAADMCHKLGIDGVVVIGGDGSFRGARDLTGAGIPCIGIPGTIDNDIASSEYTIGFDTAMNTAVQMIDRLRDTTESHDRCSVVAVGATTILVPEVPFDFQKDIIERMRFTQKTGKKHFIIIVAEGVGHVTELAEDIESQTGIESRATVLGHVQRGGSPTLRDRVVGSEMGYHAVELLSQGKSNRVIVVRNSKIIDLDITEALQAVRPFNIELYRIAHKISI